jgi:hypothetical protein
MPKEPIAKKERKSAQIVSVPLPEPPRNYGPRGIAGLLAPITRPAFKKRAPAAAQLFADWPSLAGPDLAARASPVKFAGGTLTLGCTGPTAMELQFVEAQIIGRGHGTVERLRFVQASPRLSSTQPPRPRPKNVTPPEGLPEGELGEALAKLYAALKTRG